MKLLLEKNESVTRNKESLQSNRGNRIYLLNVQPAVHLISCLTDEVITEEKMGIAFPD